MPNLVTILAILGVALVFAPRWLNAKNEKRYTAIWVVLFLLVGTGPIVKCMTVPLHRGEFFTEIKEFGPRVAIVTLGAGNTELPDGSTYPEIWGHARLEKTARLYKAAKQHGSTCIIFLVGGDPDKCGHTEAAVFADILQALGVPRSDLRLEEKSVNTYQNAQYTKPLLEAEHFDTQILVTSGLHMKRALQYFARFGIILVPAASDVMTGYLSFLPLGVNYGIGDLALKEYVGMVRLQVYEKLGWNE